METWNRLSCTLGVYEGEDAKVGISRLNGRMMSRISGGVVGRAMGGKISREAASLLKWMVH